MKIAINTLAHRTSGGGITYLKNILPRLANTEHEFVIFVPQDRNKITDISEPNIVFHHVNLPLTISPVLLLYEQLLLAYKIQKQNIDLLYSPTDIAPLMAPCSVVLAIRNPNPYYTRQVHEGWPKIKFLIQKKLTWVSTMIAARVLFVSDFSKKIVNEKIDINQEKCETIYHGIDPEPIHARSLEDSSVTATVEEHSPYLLTVSTIHKHKNFECLIEGYAKISRELRSKYPLLIAGRNADEKYSDHLSSLVVEHGLENEVFFLGEIPYEDIGCLYEGATAYVLPSKLETFGHTLLEAMTFDLPVLAANSTAIPEIAGEAASYFDPNDPDDLATNLQRVLTDETLKSQLVQNGNEQIKQFSWDRNVKQLLQTFEKVNEP